MNIKIQIVGIVLLILLIVLMEKIAKLVSDWLLAREIIDISPQDVIRLFFFILMLPYFIVELLANTPS